MDWVEVQSNDFRHNNALKRLAAGLRRTIGRASENVPAMLVTRNLDYARSLLSRQTCVRQRLFSLVLSPLSSSITPSLFHFRLKPKVS